ncbi:trafficking protein particle complex subunit 9-like [Petromyzon marinus]|uniref:trafficking protein particle complex subunit 9-like n=1 Tax=Petromyzon marinus TaxID=7757 RepID=UPI003F72A4AD
MFEFLRRGSESCADVACTPDYSHSAEDHGSLLLLILSVGDVAGERLGEALAQASSVSSVTVPRCSRPLRVRCTSRYSPEESRWGDLQGHRKVVGLIGLAECSDLDGVTDAVEKFESAKDDYGGSVCGSRLIVYGRRPDGCDGVTSDVTADVTFVSEGGPCLDLRAEVERVVVSVYAALCSSGTMEDDAAMYAAPFEKESPMTFVVGRQLKKRRQGRMYKRQGDVSLQTGSLADALMHYRRAADTLGPIGDTAWFGAALEGQCTVSCLYRSQQSGSSGCQENGRGVPTNGDEVDGSRDDGDGDGGDDANEVRSDEAIPSQRRNTRKRYDYLRDTALPVEEIIDKYKEAIACYSKHPEMAVLELEATLKAVRLLLDQRRNQEAVALLQEIIHLQAPQAISDPSSGWQLSPALERRSAAGDASSRLRRLEDPRVEHFVVVSELFALAGLGRKAALFARVAATLCVSSDNPQRRDWRRCYGLLEGALGGLRAPSLAPALPTGASGGVGWPCIRANILQLLSQAAWMLGDYALAAGHLAFLIHDMMEHLTADETKSVAGQLRRCAAACGGGAGPPGGEGVGPPLPLVSFTRLPMLRSVAAVRPPLHLLPVLEAVTPIRKNSVGSPFIYTPIKTKAQRQPENFEKVDFSTVENEGFQVELIVANPLPLELLVENVELLMEGPERDVVPVSATLPAHGEPFPLRLEVVARQPGQLTITGYRTTVLGISSDVPLKSVPGLRQTRLEVDVVPALPVVELGVTCESDGKNESFVAAPGEELGLMAFDGETRQLLVTITNVGTVPLEKLELDGAMERTRQDEPCERSDDRVWAWQHEMLSRLPLHAGEALTFSLHVHTLIDGPSAEQPSRREPRGHDCECLSRPHGAPQEADGMKRRAGSREPGHVDTKQPLKVVEFSVGFRYAGGPGMSSGYCRSVPLSVRVLVQPTVACARVVLQPPLNGRGSRLLVDVVNLAQSQVEVSLDAVTWNLLPEKGPSRVCIDLEKIFGRCGSGREQAEEAATEGRVTPDQWTSPAPQELEPPQLRDLLRIHWRSCSPPTVGRHGSLAPAAPLCPALLAHLRSTPLSWDVSVDGAVPNVEEEEVVQCAVAVPVSLEVTVRNHSGGAVGPLSLSMVLGDGTRHPEEEEEAMIARLGASVALVPQVEAWGSASFLFAIMPLGPCDRRVAFRFSESREAGATPRCVWHRLCSIGLRAKVAGELLGLPGMG